MDVGWVEKGGVRVRSGVQCVGPRRWVQKVGASKRWVQKAGAKGGCKRQEGRVTTRAGEDPNGAAHQRANGA